MTTITGTTTIPEQRAGGALAGVDNKRWGPSHRSVLGLVLLLVIAVSTGAVLVGASDEPAPTGTGATYDPAQVRWGGPDVLERAGSPARQDWGGPDVHERVS